MYYEGNLYVLSYLVHPLVYIFFCVWFVRKTWLFVVGSHFPSGPVLSDLSVQYIFFSFLLLLLLLLLSVYVLRTPLYAGAKTGARSFVKLSLRWLFLPASGIVYYVHDVNKVHCSLFTVHCSRLCF